MTDNKEIVPVTNEEEINPLTIFDGDKGINDLIAKIKLEVESEVFDISTLSGRKRMGSVARKVGSTVSTLDKIQKELTLDWRTKTKHVTTEFGRAKKELFEVRDIVKDKLDDFKLQEENRKAQHEANILKMQEYKDIDIDRRSNFINGTIISLENTFEGISDWQEFKDRAEGAYHVSLSFLNDVLKTRLEVEKQQKEELAEKDRLAEISRKEREAEIARKATEQARADAEAKAEAVKIEADKQAKLVQDKIEADKLAAEKLAEKVKQDKIYADNKAKADAEKAEQQRLDNLKQAKLDKQKAVADEKQRAEEEKQKEIDAQKAREADKEHKKIYNTSAVNALIELASLNQHQAQQVVISIAKNQIPHIKINY